MEPYSTPPTSHRQTIVSTVLAGMAAGFFLLLFVLISGGFFIFLIGIIGALVAFGGLHYVLWGRLLTKETAGEGEEELLRQRALAREVPERPDNRFWR